MTSTLTVGRCVIDRCVSSISMSGDRLLISGFFDGDSLAHGKVIRQQLLGLVGNDDEPVVPLVSTLDSDLDGFYRVFGASCQPRRGTTFKPTSIGGRHDFAIDLERVGGGYRVPTLEIPYIVDDHVGYTGTAASTLPIAGLAYETSSSETYDQFATTGPSISLGACPVADAYAVTTLQAAPGSTGVISGLASPVTFYSGSARVEAFVGGAWHVLVGRQVPGGLTSLRISNGHVRLTPSADGVTPASLEVWDGSAWQARNVSWVGSTGAIYASEIGETIVNTSLPWVIERNSHSSVSISRPGGFRASLRSGSNVVALFPFESTIRGVGFTATTAMVSQTQGATLDSTVDWAFGIPAAGITANTTDGRVHRAAGAIPVAYMGGSSSATPTGVYRGAFTTAAGDVVIVAR